LKYVLKAKKGISTLVATILMINTAIVMGAVMIAWAMGLIGTYQGGTQVQYMLMGERAQEAIVIEHVWFINMPPSKSIIVFVRNVGAREAQLVSLYVGGSSYAANVTWPYTLPMSNKVALQITYDWSSGASYLIVVATKRGNQARGEWTP